MRYKIKINSQQKGFTIVEALIVLAVTGMLFVSTSLLIRGQIEKTRYQDSMRQLQQMVQNTIDDVENGYMSSVDGTNQTTLLVGKRFWFCADDASLYSFCAGVSGSVINIETVEQQIGSNTLDFSNNSTQNLPGGLKFLYFRTLQILPNPPGPQQKEFGSSVLFTDMTGSIGASATSANRISLFNRSGSQELKSVAPNQGFILCFEGYKVGSLELGSAKSGTRVLLNIEDPRCTV